MLIRERLSKDYSLAYACDPPGENYCAITFVMCCLCLHIISGSWLVRTHLGNHSKSIPIRCKTFPLSTGLTAASLFIETHAGHLEEMDLSSLLRFAPLQDVLVNKFESRPELLSQSGIAVTEYLKQAPAQDVRLFIWTLEEHRDQYDYCHTILDEFFEILGKSFGQRLSTF